MTIKTLADKLRSLGAGWASAEEAERDSVAHGFGQALARHLFTELPTSGGIARIGEQSLAFMLSHAFECGRRTPVKS